MEIHGEASITSLQYTCLFSTVSARLQESNARSQAVEDLREQLELKRLYANCDQVIYHSEANPAMSMIE